jgi:hypothetical protein
MEFCLTAKVYSANKNFREIVKGEIENKFYFAFFFIMLLENNKKIIIYDD